MWTVSYTHLDVYKRQALGGIYQMKKDSADGRLFMWKIAAQAVSEHPWTGCGWNSVKAAYGLSLIHI